MPHVALLSVGRRKKKHGNKQGKMARRQQEKCIAIGGRGRDKWKQKRIKLIAVNFAMAHW